MAERTARFANRDALVHIANHMTGIPSPCVDVCDVDSTGQYCIGCGRSMDEIASWLSASDDERHAIMEKLPERLRQLKR